MEPRSLATKEDLKNLDFKLTNTIHLEISSFRKLINTNIWRLIIWLTVVKGMTLTGVFYMARIYLRKKQSPRSNPIP